MQSKIYHERQSLFHCGIHAVNNILQSAYYNKESFDKIAKDLYEIEKESKIKHPLTNPYKNAFGLGNYDITVIETALNIKNYTLRWWDMRKSVEEIDFFDESLIGIIINDRGEKNFFKSLFKWAEPNHWFAIRRINQDFYDLDSRNNTPIMFKDYEKLKKKLDFFKKNDGFIFLIFKG